MNFCSKCGSQLNPNTQFCGNCGTPSNPQPNAAVNVQNQQQNQSFMVNQPMQQPASQPDMHNGYQRPELPGDKKKSKKGLISFIVILFLIVAVLSGYYFLTSSPKYVYQNLYKQMANRVLDIIPEKNNDVINKTVSLDMDIDLPDELIDENVAEIINLINAIKLSTNYQFDNNTKELVLKLDVNYGKESIVDAAVFANLKNNEAYVLAKDYYDKYVKVSADDFSVYIDVDTNLSTGQIANIKKIKKLFVNELVKVIETNDVSKTGGKYVLEISSKEIAKRYSKIFKDMANNKNILKCFENEDEVKKSFEDASAYFAANVENLSDEKIKITVTKSFIGNGIKQVIIEKEDTKIVFDVTKGKVDYKVLSSKEEVVSGYLKYDEVKETSKYELSVSIPDVGTFKINVELTDKKVSSVEKVDSAKTIELENITGSEMQDIMDKFENSKLSQLVNQITGMINGVTGGAYEDVAKVEAETMVMNIETTCQLAELYKQMGLVDSNMCADGLTTSEVTELIEVSENTKVDYVSYYNNKVQYLRITCNGITVTYDGVNYNISK